MIISGIGALILVLVVLALIAVVIWLSVKVSNTSASFTGATGQGTTSFAAVQVLLLSSSITGYAQITDPDLIGVWGAAIDPETILPNQVDLWVANNGFEVSTGSVEKYRYVWSQNTGALGIHPIISMNLIELHKFQPVMRPTGVVSNTSTTSFVISSGGVTGPARAIIVTELGEIVGINTAVSTNVVSVLTATGANFKGCTILNDALYVANWNTGQVDVYDSKFAYVFSFSGPDSNLIPVAGYSVFNVATINGQIFAALAYRNGQNEPTPGVGNGFIDVFHANGTFARRFTVRGPLNSPWEMVFVTSVNSLSGYDEVIVGNNGDGQAHRFLYSTGTYISNIKDQFNNVLTVDNLYSIIPLPFVNIRQAFLTASIVNDTDGLIAIGIANAPALNPNTQFPI